LISALPRDALLLKSTQIRQAVIASSLVRERHYHIVGAGRAASLTQPYTCI